MSNVVSSTLVPRNRRIPSKRLIFADHLRLMRRCHPFPVVIADRSALMMIFPFIFEADSLVCRNGLVQYIRRRTADLRFGMQRSLDFEQSGITLGDTLRYRTEVHQKRAGGDNQSARTSTTDQHGIAFQALRRRNRGGDSEKSAHPPRPI